MSLTRRLRNLFTKNPSNQPQSNLTTPRSPSAVVVTNEARSRGRTSEATATGANTSNTTQPRTRTTTTTITNADGTTTTTTSTRRRRRRRRRPESPVGLPLYSEEPGDDEMSLFKGASVSRTDLLDPEEDDDDEDGDDAGSDVEGALSREEGQEDRVDGAGFQGGAPLTTRATTMSSFSVGGDSSARRFSMLSSPVANRMRSTSDVNSIAQSSDYPATSALSNALPIARTADSPSSPISLSPTSSRPIAHHASQSSPGVLTTNSLSFSPVASSRHRSSTLRSIFTRRNASSSALSLPGEVGRSPYGQGFSPAGSSSRLASASTASIRSTASISAPLQHTLVSSSFVFPKAGPTASQIAFISSREALGAFGYGPGAETVPSIDDHAHQMSPDEPLEPPPAVFSDNSSNTRSSPPPPPSNLLNTSSGSVSARGHRSASVSSQMSLSPLSRLAHREGDEEDDPDRGRLPTVPSTPMDENPPMMSSLADSLTIEPTTALGDATRKLELRMSDTPLITLDAGTPISPLFPRSPGGNVLVSTTTTQNA